MKELYTPGVALPLSNIAHFPGNSQHETATADAQTWKMISAPVIRNICPFWGVGCYSDSDRQRAFQNGREVPLTVIPGSSLQRHRRVTRQADDDELSECALLGLDVILPPPDTV